MSADPAASPVGGQNAFSDPPVTIRTLVGVSGRTTGVHDPRSSRLGSPLRGAANPDLCAHLGRFQNYNLLDGRDQFFHSLRPSLRKYILTLRSGLRLKQS